MADIILTWQGPNGTVRLEQGPRGGVQWVIVDASGKETRQAKSPTFGRIEALGIDSKAVLDDYNGWKAGRDVLPEPVPLTPEAVTEMVVALDLFEIADAEALGQYLFAATQEQRDALVATYYDTLVGQITGEMSQDILNRAAALAETAADSLLRTFTEADLNAMGKVISEGIAAGLNPRDIARNLEMVQGLDANRIAAFEKFRAELEANPDLTDGQIAAAEEREFQRLLDERKETIARTESAKAVSEGDHLEAKNNGAQFKVWQTTGDDRVSDECQANEAAGPIPIDDDFPGGVSTCPQHPNCRCAVTFITDEGQLTGAEDRAAQRAERTAAAKNEGDAA